MNDHKFELLLPVNVIKQRFQSIFFNNYLSLCECFKKLLSKQSIPILSYCLTQTNNLMNGANS